MNILINILIVAFVLGLVMMLIYAPHLMYKGSLTIQYGKLDTKEKAMSWLPLYNVICAVKTSLGSARIITVTSVISLLSFVGLLSCTALKQSELIFVFSWLFIISTIVNVICNQVAVFKILYTSCCVSLAKCILLAIIYPLGQSYIGKWLPLMIRQKDAREGIF